MKEKTLRAYQRVESRRAKTFTDQAKYDRNLRQIFSDTGEANPF